MGWRLGLGLGSELRHALRHDALSPSVSNNFVHVRRIGIVVVYRTYLLSELKKFHLTEVIVATAGCGNGSRTTHLYLGQLQVSQVY